MQLFDQKIIKEDITLENEFYQESIILLEGVIIDIISKLDIIRKYRTVLFQKDPIEYYKARIKSAVSIKEKLKRSGLPVTLEAALTEIYDAAGIRVICPFVDDVYLVADILKKQQDITVIKEKDYIQNPKQNGYRSYHMIVETSFHLADQIQKAYCEIQIRTIAMDCWASLEHQMKYKKDIGNQDMLVAELKRCADEIASTDLNLQTIRDMIENEEVK